MERWEIEKLIRDVIRQELVGIMMGKTLETTSEYRVTAQRFSNETPIPNQRIISPYGVASRPVPTTECVVAPVSNDPTHLNVLGCNDTTRPPVAEGETAVYSSGEQVIHLKADGSIHQGTSDADEAVVLGNVLLEFMTKFFTDLTTSPQIGYDIFGLPVFLDPTLLTKFTQYKLQYLDTATTNIVGQKNFVERGD